MNVYEQRRLNDAKGLHFIHQFGWLRTAELGKLLWPNNASNRQAADRLARSWIARKFVIIRELPDGVGRALVLATGGVRFLAQNGIAAGTGKDIGRFTNKGWLPPSSWRHDLIAHGVLCELHRKGFTIYPEALLRRQEKHLVKIPDGFAVIGHQGIWLEVEHTRKTGKEMRNLAQALGIVANGEAVRVAGVRPTAAMVAFVPSAQDERGHALGHQDRVRNAVQAVAKSDVVICWAKCSLIGTAGVGYIDFQQEHIKTDLASAILKRLDANWLLDEDGQAATYGNHVAHVWKEDNDRWGYAVERIGGNQVEANYASNITEAKRNAASVLAKIHPAR